MFIIRKKHEWEEGKRGQVGREEDYLESSLYFSSFVWSYCIPTHSVHITYHYIIYVILYMNTAKCKGGPGSHIETLII